MEIVEILNKYGNPTNLKTGDFVLIDGFDNLNIFVILGEVTKIEGDNVEVKEITKYFLSGRSTKCSGDISTHEKEGLLKPIRDRLIDQNDFIKWLANQF